MKALRTIFPTLFLLTLWLVPVEVYADTFTITGGTLTYSTSGGSPFLLTGNGLMLSGSTTSLNSGVSLFSNGIVAQGQTLSTGGSIDSQDAEIFLSNPIMAGGSFSPGASYLGLSFSSANFTVPIGFGSDFVVTAPFMLSGGIVEGYQNLVGVGPPVFSGGLQGQGTTILTFVMTPSGHFQLFSQTFNFGPIAQGVTVTPVPEPATVLLLGSGLAGLYGATRRKFRTKNRS